MFSLIFIDFHWFDLRILKIRFLTLPWKTKFEEWTICRKSHFWLWKILRNSLGRLTFFAEPWFLTLKNANKFTGTPHFFCKIKFLTRSKTWFWPIFRESRGCHAFHAFHAAIRSKTWFRAKSGQKPDFDQFSVKAVAATRFTRFTLQSGQRTGKVFKSMSKGCFSVNCVDVSKSNWIHDFM